MIRPASRPASSIEKSRHNSDAKGAQSYMLAGIGWLELSLLALVVLVIFGPRYLPRIGRGLGRSWRNLIDGLER
jgi:hypothetical protein